MLLTLNLGSSSLKSALFKSSEHCLWRSEIRGALPEAEPRAIGYRVVHGGEIDEPTRIDRQLLDHLRSLIPLAPLHLPAEIELIERAMERWPKSDHLACFDTAFHRTLPPKARRLPLPTQQMRRYGFHGLSYTSIVDQMGNELAERAIVAHLGSGSSMTALYQGRSIETTMGFTPTGGLMMATRCGDLDPGALLYLLRHKVKTIDELEELLNQHSGLRGVSGITGDMRQLLASDEPAAAAAVELYCYKAQQAIGQLIASLGGCEQLLFTGGIGANCAQLREAILEGVRCFGIEDVRAIVTDEEKVIARCLEESFTPSTS